MVWLCTGSVDENTYWTINSGCLWEIQGGDTKRETCLFYTYNKIKIHAHYWIFTTLTTYPGKEKRSTYWHIFLKADSGWPGDCNRFSNSGSCWSGYHSVNLTSKRSFSWNLGLSLGLSQCNTSRGCDRALHFHRRISRLLSILDILCR